MSIDWARAGAVRTVRTVLPAALAVALSGPSAVAQMPASRAVEAVSYTNPVDGTRLTGWLALPGTAGPHPGIVAAPDRRNRSSGRSAGGRTISVSEQRRRG